MNRAVPLQTKQSTSELKEYQSGSSDISLAAHVLRCSVSSCAQMLSLAAHALRCSDMLTASLIIPHPHLLQILNACPRNSQITTHDVHTPCICLQRALTCVCAVKLRLKLSEAILHARITVSLCAWTCRVCVCERVVCVSACVCVSCCCVACWWKGCDGEWHDLFVAEAL